jgi:hypothetical protein
MYANRKAVADLNPAAAFRLGNRSWDGPHGDICGFVLGEAVTAPALPCGGGFIAHRNETALKLMMGPPVCPKDGRPLPATSNCPASTEAIADTTSYGLAWLPVSNEAALDGGLFHCARLRSLKQKDADQQTCCKCPEA